MKHQNKGVPYKILPFLSWVVMGAGNPSGTVLIPVSNETTLILVDKNDVNFASCILYIRMVA